MTCVVGTVADGHRSTLAWPGQSSSTVRLIPLALKVKVPAASLANSNRPCASAVVCARHSGQQEEIVTTAPAWQVPPATRASAHTVGGAVVAGVGVAAVAMVVPEGGRVAEASGLVSEGKGSLLMLSVPQAAGRSRRPASERTSRATRRPGCRLP
jgi:hypothetical protein